MEITAIIISALAFILSIVTYFRFDRKIKQQEEIINAHEIDKIKEEELEKSFAHLTMRTYWRDKGTLFLIIGNDGPSDAYNVSIIDLDKESFIFQNAEESLPIKTIYAGDNEQIELMVYSDMPNKTRIQVEWDDDSKQHHVDKPVISIHG